MINKQIIDAIEQMGRGQKIDKNVLVEAIQSAVSSASKKTFGARQDVRVDYNEESGELKIFIKKKVAEKVTSPQLEISRAEAKLIDAAAKVGDVVEIQIEPDELGRIAAQTAKQVVTQRMREAERQRIFEEYKAKIGSMVSGIILHKIGSDIIIGMEAVEGILPRREQVFRENYRTGEKLRLYVVDVRKESRSPQIILSRTHPNLLRRLFEAEVPEVTDGIVEIKSVSREPGHRTKVAVYSQDKNIDPVGACVGMRGARVQAIVWELKGEKIDIVEWSQDINIFIANALSPAKIKEIIIDEAKKSAVVVVFDTQLSLAIGKKGQNVRLTSRLTGWKVDVKSESALAEELKKKPEEAAVQAETAQSKGAEQEENKSELNLPGITRKTTEALLAAGYKNAEDIAKATLEDLEKISGIGAKTAEKILKSVEQVSEKEVSDGKVDKEEK